MIDVRQEDIFVQLMDLPIGTNEVVTPNEDGSYTIFINAKQAHEGQLKSYKHGMRHIENGDFEKDDVQKIEFAAHYTEAEPKPVPAKDYIKELERLRRERKKLRDQLKEAEERVEFMSHFVDYFKIAENQWLYGEDL